MGEQAKSGARPPRGDGGRFAPGVSGNPAGRPKGSRDKRTEFLEELLGDDGEVIVRKLVACAKEGQGWAVRLAVDRLVPARRVDRRVTVPTLGRVDTSADVRRAVADVIEMAAAGEMTVEDSAALLRLVAEQRKVIAEDMEARLRQIEQLLSGAEESNG